MASTARPSAPRARKTSGFTLLEMLVVMVLLGVISSLALPAMQRWHDALQSRAQSGALVEALRAAVFAAGAQRRDLVMDERSFAPPGKGVDAHVALTLPPGWTLRRVVPARFLANGLCRPGMLVLRTDRDSDLVVRVDGPVCQVDVSVQAPQQ